MNKLINLVTPKKSLLNLSADNSGGVAVMTALFLPVLIGFCALAVDVSIWLSQTNAAQGTADLAAWGAQGEATAGGTATQIQNEVLSIAVANGFTNGQNGVVVALNNPPLSGNYTTNSKAYEVIITQPQQLYFGGLLGIAPTVKGRAVAATPTARTCLMALDASAAKSIQVDGGTTMTLPCNIYNDSTNSDDTDMGGGAHLTGTNVSLAGNYSGLLTATGSLKTNTTPATDPYASYSIPSYSGCTYTNYSNGSPQTISASGGIVVFCGDLTVGHPLTLTNGVFIIDRGSLKANSDVTTTNATLIVTSSTGSNFGAFDFNNGTFSLSAATSGSTAGIALWVDKRAGVSNQTQFQSSATLTINGAVYAPGSTIQFQGSGAVTGCVQVVADMMHFHGGNNFNVSTNCSAYNIKNVGGGGGSGTAGLVE